MNGIISSGDNAVLKAHRQGWTLKSRFDRALERPWRRVWDSNPRTGLTVTRFRIERLKPGSANPPCRLVRRPKVVTCSGGGETMRSGRQCKGEVLVFGDFFASGEQEGGLERSS